MLPEIKNIFILHPISGWVNLGVLLKNSTSVISDYIFR